MKKNKLLVLVASSLLTLSSCGGGETSSSIEEKGSGEEESALSVSKSENESEGDSEAEASNSQHSGLPIYSDDLVTTPSVVIHYFALDGDYENTAIWFWKDGAGGQEFFFEYTEEEHGEYIAVIPLNTPGLSGPTFEDKVGIIFRAVADWSWQTRDLMVNLPDFTPRGNALHVYFQKGDETPRAEGLYERIDAFKVLNFVSLQRISVQVNGDVDNWTLYCNSEVLHSGQTKGEKQTFYVRLDDLGAEVVADLENVYELEVHFIDNDHLLKEVVSFEGLYGTDAFNEKYAYDGDDLGVTLEANKTTFKVWSPLSDKIVLRVYGSGTPKEVDPVLGDDAHEDFEMTKGEKGVFSVSVDRNLDDHYYTYVVTNNTYTEKEIVDPYARSAGVNGLRGMILDFSRTNPEDWDEVTPKDYDRKELAVYETHLVDPTMSPTWTDKENIAQLRGTYKGFIESGTTYSDGDTTVSTGFDSIKGLGVNAIQLQPIFDQANDEIHKEFNWGYNPLNYNCLEGAYSTDPYDGAVRVREFKELIKATNKEGINVIMDVVYNHVNSVNGENFDVLMPRYYFRYDSEGRLSNGSGCGNETASDHRMFSKFMIDSAKFWATEYKLGGYRFDLMALHDLETMNELVKEVKEATFDNFCIYGEPWTGGSSTLGSSYQAKQDNMRQFKGFGSFNDLMRDGLMKSGMNSTSSKGWAMVEGKTKANTSDAHAIGKGIQGATASSRATVKDTDPNKAVNYASCHDNYTLTDRIAIAYSNDGGKTTTASDELLHYGPMLANALVLGSNGTSFMLSGEEMLRTKIKPDGTRDGNSYNASYEENALDYSMKIENLDVYDFYTAMINLKKAFSGFHLEEEDAKQVEYEISSDNSTITYSITGEFFETDYEFDVFARNGTEGEDTIIDSLDSSAICLADSRGIYANQAAGDNGIALKPLQFLVFAKRV